MKLFVLTLLATGCIVCIAAHGDNRKFGSDRKHSSGRSTNKNDYVESSTQPPSTPDGSRCITTHTKKPKKTPKPTTTPSTTTTSTPTTTPDFFDGCEWCLDTELSVGDISAGQCYPEPYIGGCFCRCGDLFCREGQIIDRTTCVKGGSLNDCRCIDAYVSSTTSSPTPT